MIEAGDDITVPETVLLELLSGPTDELLVVRRRRMLEAFHIAASEPVADSLRAAASYACVRTVCSQEPNVGICRF